KRASRHYLWLVHAGADGMNTLAVRTAIVLNTRPYSHAGALHVPVPFESSEAPVIELANLRKLPGAALLGLKKTVCCLIMVGAVAGSQDHLYRAFLDMVPVETGLEADERVTVKPNIVSVPKTGVLLPMEARLHPVAAVRRGRNRASCLYWPGGPKRRRVRRGT